MVWFGNQLKPKIVVSISITEASDMTRYTNYIIFNVYDFMNGSLNMYVNSGLDKLFKLDLFII